MALIPEKLHSFKVYLNGQELIGIANATLPSLESVTSTVKGAGIAGEYESLTVGHYKSMRLSLKFLTVTSAASILMQQESHALELYGAIQVYNSIGPKNIEATKLKVKVKGHPIKIEFGKFESGSLMDTQVDLELTYLKVMRDDVELCEIDKMNFISTIMGKDTLAPFRAALGMSGSNEIVEAGVNKLRSITGI